MKKNKTDIVYKTFECDCSSADHTIRLVYVPPYKTKSLYEEPSLYIDVQLCKTKNIFQRVIAAVKYIFGYECRYGHWDCTLIRLQDVDDMKKLLDTYKNDARKYQPKKRS